MKHSSCAPEGELAVPRSAVDWCERTPSISWSLALVVLTMLAIGVLWWPLMRIPAHDQVAYIEGANAYRQAEVASGGRLYGAQPGYVFAFYAPLSFHLVAGLGKVTGNAVVAGRWLSVASLFAIAILIAMTVRRLTSLGRGGIYAALMFVIFVGIYKPDRIGMDDAHLFGLAFSAAGLYFLVRGPDSTRWLCASAAAFAISLFTKQSLLALPGAAAIWLLPRSRKAFLTWLGMAAAVCTVLLAVTVAVDGPYLLQHFATPQPYSLDNMWEAAGWYLLYFQGAIAAAVVWSFFAPRRSPAQLLAGYLGLAHVFGFWFAAAYGADRNHLFDAILAVSLISGVLVPYAARLSSQTVWRMPLLTVLLLVPFLGVVAPLFQRIGVDLAAQRDMPAREAEFGKTSAFLKSQPGDALCENLLVCLEGQKPELYDAFAMGQLVRNRKMSEDGWLRLIRDRRVSAIQMDVIDAGPELKLNGRQRFPESFVGAVRSDYRLALRTAHFAVFVPK